MPWGSFRTPRFEQSNLVRVSFQFIRRFQIERQIAQEWMIDDPCNGLRTDIALADLVVAILMGATGIFGVVQMEIWL